MLQGFRRLSARFSLFWRYFFLLATVLSLFLLALLAVTGRYAAVLRSSRMEEAQTAFEKNCEMFSRDLFKPYALPAVVEETDDFAAAANTDSPYTPEYAYRFSRVRDFFGKLCLVQELPEESFLYFRRSRVFVTRSRIFSDAGSYFGAYLSYEDPGQTPNLTFGRSLPKLELLPAAEISVGGRPAGTYLTLLVRTSPYNTLYGFLYPQADVLEAFRLSALPEGTTLTLTHTDGTPLFSYGPAEGGGSLVRLEQRIPAVSCVASLGIPSSYFDASARSTQTAARVVFLLFCAAGLAICALFSLFSVRPFRRLIRAHGADQTPQKNEFAALDGVLTQARQQTDSLQSMFLSSLLIRSTAGLPVSEEEFQRALAAFPVFRQPLRAAVVYDRAADYELDDTNSMGSLLQAFLPEQFLCHYNNMQEAILLLPDTPPDREALLTLLRELNGGATADLRFVCGVSDPFTGLNDAGVSIRQAQSCIPDGEESMISRPLSDEEEEPVAFEPEQLRQALAARDREEVLSRIEQLAAQASRGGSPSPEELFYRTLALLRDCARANKLSFEEYENAAYQHTRSPASNLRRFKAVALNLLDQLAAAQRSDKQQRCEAIVQFVRDHYSDPTLCVASLARQFGASERFVYNSVQEATGMNVSTFLARTRMTEAARLLQQTEKSVAEVAEECGYPVESTFYRNFKKYYGMTPAEYKNYPDAAAPERSPS